MTNHPTRNYPTPDGDDENMDMSDADHPTEVDLPRRPLQKETTATNHSVTDVVVGQKTRVIAPGKKKRMTLVPAAWKLQRDIDREMAVAAASAAAAAAGKEMGVATAGKKRGRMDDLVDALEQCGLSEPGQAAKRFCGGFGGEVVGDGGVGGEQGADGEKKLGLALGWVEGKDRDSLSDKADSDYEHEEYDGSNSCSWESCSESSDGSGGEVEEEELADLGVEKKLVGPPEDMDSDYSDENDDEYEESDWSSDVGSDASMGSINWDSDANSTESSDWGSDMDDDEVGEELVWLGENEWINYREEAATFPQVEEAIKGKVQGKQPPFVRCSLCLDTQLSILGLPIYNPIYREDIRRLEPGVVLICGHMFCRACWKRYCEECHFPVDGEEEEDTDSIAWLDCPICHIELSYIGCRCEITAVHLPLNEQDPAASFKYQRKHRDGKWKKDFPHLAPNPRKWPRRCSDCTVSRSSDS